MDKALELRMKSDKNEFIENPHDYLSQSKIVKKYSELGKLNPLGQIFALTGLAEIPFSTELAITQRLIQSVNQRLATAEGFSYTGQLEDIVPCHNAMLLEAYSCLGLGESPQAQNALNWIKQYQVFDRETSTSWPYKGICKFGGCMKSTPCYIGIGKSVKALLTYHEKVNGQDNEVKTLIEKGIEYMLSHQLFKRLSVDQPISRHITDSIFPQSYFLSFTDLVYIVGMSGKQNDSRTLAFFELLAQKQTSA